MKMSYHRIGIFRLSRELLFHPNPTSGNFTLQLQYTGVTDVKITFYNSEGKEVKKWYGEGQSHYIFSSSLNMQGHYLLDIISDYEHKGIKMIVQ